MVTRIQSTSSSDEDYQQAVETSHFIFLVTITPYIVRLTIIHFIISCFLTLSLPESIMETCGVVLTFESVDKILCCDHVNETSSAVLLHGTICFSVFYKVKFGIFLNFDTWQPQELNG